MIFLLASFLASFFFVPASAYDNLCRSYDEPSQVIGKCGDRYLPSDKVRNYRNINLRCGSGVDHYRRTFIPFDYDQWEILEDEGDLNAMQALRQKEKAIQWTGTIPYETIETWDWTDCVLGQHPVCGTHQECHDETRTVTDKDGKTSTYTEEVCIDVLNTCYHDQEESESRFCSTERMDFHAWFKRPTHREWNPKTSGYYDVIPNKYDLLPGEIEDIQVFSNSSSSATIQPEVTVGDAWNTYSPRIEIQQSGRNSISCRYNQPLNVNIEIVTTGRIFGKKTPNAFRIPVDEEGNEVSPLKFDEFINKKNDLIRYKPIRIDLLDASYTMITAMARQSRAFDMEREEAKEKNGLGSTLSPKKHAQERKKAIKSGFWKNTEVRIRSYQRINYARDPRIFHNLYTNSSKSSMMGSFEIDLIGSTKPDDLYRASGPFSDKLWDWISVPLDKNAKYSLMVSMYQAGVPFYKQAKDPDDKDSCFSKELDLGFSTSSGVDPGSLFQKTVNHLRGR